MTCPTSPEVPGELMEEDATRSTPNGRTMHGVGTHHATTEYHRFSGHRQVPGRSVRWDRTCPLAPPLDRQAQGCNAAAVAFQRTIERMETRASAQGNRWSCASHAGWPGRNTPGWPPPPAARFAACARPAGTRRSRLSFHGMRHENEMCSSRPGSQAPVAAACPSLGSLR
jgi:hypothetical protein